jgi:hypothetical protein
MDIELWKTVETVNRIWNFGRQDESVKRIWSFEREVESVKRIWSFGTQLNLLNGYGDYEDS